MAFLYPSVLILFVGVGDPVHPSHTPLQVASYLIAGVLTLFGCVY